MNLQAIQDKIYNLAEKENHRELSLLLKMDFSNQAYTCFTINTELTNFIERDKYLFRKAIIQSHQKIMDIYPDYYQGLIFLSLAYYEIKEYHLASKLAHEAHELINKLGLENNEWLEIATSLFDLAMEIEGNYLDYINRLELDINRIKAKREGNTLFCSKCSTFNPKKTKKCIQCGNKLSKKDDIENI